MNATIAPETLGQAWDRLRARRPRVHCITNTVVQGFTANVLLAAGAVPSMTTDPDEIGDFVDRADALLVNLGTLDADRRRAIGIALDHAQARALPVVLDPVFIDTAAPRRDFARALLARRIAVIRGNEAEIAALGPVSGSVLAVTAAIDRILGPTGDIRIANGHAYGALVTGMGCALSALTAAMLAAEPDPMLAAAAAFAGFGIAQERAAALSRGPGGFAANLLDALHALDADALARETKLA